MTAAERELTIVRVLDAPRELVFRAWTDPEHLAAWFGPRGCTTPRSTVAADVRPGGTWRATMIREDTGAELPTGGFYIEVREPERLVFTWRDPGGSGEESVVTVALADLGGRTEMTFHQAGFSSDGYRAGVHEGWSSSFDRLAEQLTDNPRRTRP
ncbi:polyketide cyclase [Pseudonocardia sp. CNS-139]|nr:polyketide cyclase [Pseudonocardia sp. CNS-139]